MILDFSYRLPGPLSTHFLIGQGFEVTKIELKEKPDPFRVGKIPACRKWYKKINDKKKVKSLSINNVLKTLKEEKKNIEGVITDMNMPLNQGLIDWLNRENIIVPFINIHSSRSGRPMHDLDILASINYFNEETKIPEFPFVGVLFAQRISNEFLAQKLTLTKTKSTQTISRNIFLEDLSKDILHPIVLPLDQRFYAGKLLGYNKYELDDGFLYLTALEKKSWDNFVNFINYPEKMNVNSDDSNESPDSKKFINFVKNLKRNFFKKYPENKRCFHITETHHTE